MSSPIPPDPYVALGVPDTADLNTIRTAHRKLVLKFHPDRIKDEADREKGKAEFQKVQQAYELLSDSNRRARYDDQIKLAELRKEKMMRDSARSTVSASRSSPPGMTVRREARADHYFEERAPPREDYFDQDRYDEPLPRGPPRKRDSYEKRPIPTPRASERKEKPASKWDHPVGGMSFDMAFRLKQKAAQVKERAARDNALKAEMRDKEKRRDRSEKQSSRKAAYVEDDFSGSESDTVVPNHSSRPERPSTARSRTQVDREPSRRSAPQSRRSSHEYEPENYSDGDKWERHHAKSRDYIFESQQKRPTISRTGSDALHYWGGDQSGPRRSGNENDKQSSSSRRTPADNTHPRPSMAAYSSDPGKLRPHVVDREPVRAKTVYPAERPITREPPGLARSQTMPVSRGSRKENNAPVRGSNLKHTETQPDSGYYSSSNPHTPEMRGESPPNIRDFREPPSNRRQQSTKYAIVDEAESDEDVPRRHRVTRISNSDEDDNRHRRYRSPVSEVHDRERPRERNERPRLPKLDTDTRPRPVRAPESRTSVPRTEFQSSRASPSVPRKQLFNEVTPEERNYRYDPAHLKTAPPRGPASATYTNYRTRSPDDDYSPSSRFREGLEGGVRRPSPQYA